MKLRWNILYLITLAFIFVAFMAMYVDLPGELLGGLAGGLITLVAAVARELIEDKPSLAANVAGMFAGNAGSKPCEHPECPLRPAEKCVVDTVEA